MKPIIFCFQLLKMVLKTIIQPYKFNFVEIPRKFTIVICRFTRRFAKTINLIVFLLCQSAKTSKFYRHCQQFKMRARNSGLGGHSPKKGGKSGNKINLKWSLLKASAFAVLCRPFEEAPR